MVKGKELDDELKTARAINGAVPLYFDIKGRQLRVTEVIPNKDHLEIMLNHPIEVPTPTTVLFKAGADYARLLSANGRHLVFEGGPEYMVYEGESLHIRHPQLKVSGPTFLDYEIEKIEKAKAAGFNKYFLSYVESQKDIDEFRDFVGNSEIVAKIENKQGLDFVQNKYKKQDNLGLMAACGDLFVEVDKPHEVLNAIRLIIKKDSDAAVGSRLLLSVINSPVPSLADLAHLGWLYDIGYRTMMLCDELCLKQELLNRAVNVFDAFRDNYASRPPIVPVSAISPYSPFVVPPHK
ncbi:hypothetical protein HY486_01775 [Candidatus Woesearchaeota archaeon]|nr:hypothetical protein [Candidatus Woesearchaeota archaeon]